MVVDADLVARLLREAEGTWFALPVTMAVATGMRRGEVLGLRWADLDSEFTVAHVRRSLQVVRGELLFAEPKTRRSRRSVPLPGIVHRHLRAQRSAQQERRRTSKTWLDLDLVMHRGDGGPVNPGTLSSGWHRFCRLRGLPPVRFHDLRHGHATLMLLQGVHPKVVSERLGHASIGITLDNSQYTEDEYLQRVGWGHSSVVHVVTFAEICDVRRLVMFHHDPLHTDDQVEALLGRATELWNAGGIPPVLAYEGMELDLS